MNSMRDMQRFDVVVVGGGPAGVTAALRVSELGATVAFVERGHLGGTCTNDGRVPTRVLAHAARLLRDAEQQRAYGLVCERPSLDFAALIAHTQRVVYRMHEKKGLAGHLESAHVTVFEGVGEAAFTDANCLALRDGTRVSGDRFILCVGGKPRRLAFLGAEHALTHSDVWSLTALPRRVAVVGAAATGCQLASVFAAFGSEVTLLDVARRILAGEDEDVSQAVAQAFERRGLTVVPGMDGVERIERVADGLRLAYTVGSETVERGVDAVVLAVGWPGNVETLNLEVAGVKTERGYIAVDDAHRTSAPHIYAAGDITGRMMLVQSAGYEARVAAENAVLDTDTPSRHAIVPHGGFTGPEYGSVGLTEAQAREREAVGVAFVPYADMDRAVIDGRPDGFCKLVVSRESRRILGAHVVGEQAVEVVQLVAAGMAADMRVEQLGDLELAYPTYAAIVGLAARQVARELGLLRGSGMWRTLGNPRAAEWEREEAEAGV